MDSAAWLAVFTMVVAAEASFFFSLAETALFSLGKWQVTQLAAKYPRSGSVLARLLGEPQDVLATLVLGNICAVSTVLGVGLWMALSGQWSFALAAIVILLLALFGGEVLPKTLAVRNSEKWALRVALPLSGFHRFLRPFHQLAQKLNRLLLSAFTPKSVRPLVSLTDADYRELLDLAYHQGTLAESEREIILQIISLDRRTAKDVMKPRWQLACIPDDLSVEEMIAAARRFKHRRLPMFDETPDTIVGILNTHALLGNPNGDLADAIEFPSFVPETMNLFQLMKSLQRQRRGMAIVLDEFGGTAGLVTMEDILTEVVGRIRGEVESGGFVMERLASNRWRVSGTMRVDDFRREHPTLPDTGEVETMGGLLVHLLGVVPKQGESATFGGLKLSAALVDERRVRQLTVERGTP